MNIDGSKANMDIKQIDARITGIYRSKLLLYSGRSKYDPRRERRLDDEMRGLFKRKREMLAHSSGHDSGVSN
jgi:hypothetical protein